MIKAVGGDMSRIAPGVGSMLNFSAPCLVELTCDNFCWTPKTFGSFVDKAISLGVEEIGVWPAHIDGWGTMGTAPWFLDILRCFLAGEESSCTPTDVSALARTAPCLGRLKSDDALLVRPPSVNALGAALPLHSDFADVLFSMRVTLKTDDVGALLTADITADTIWVVSPAESDAVAAVIGRPARHLQPNNMKRDGKGCGSDARCRNVGPFRQAQVRSDLGQDAYKVLGSPPVLLSEPPSTLLVSAGEVVMFLGTVGAAPWLLQLFPALAHDCTSGTWEEHCVRSFSFGNGSAIVATGTGDRGAIFAAYELSHELLGVSPIWYWSGREPAYRGSVTVALPLNLSFGRPDYKYRALFPNDEDLLAGHFADPAGQNVISVEPWSRLCETA